MDSFLKSRLRSDYERLQDNEFWKTFIARVKAKAEEAERAAVHGPMDTPEAVALRTMLYRGQFEAFRSVLGLPASLVESAPPKS